MHSFRFIATKSRKKLQSSRFIANTSRESCNHLNLSPTKFAKMYSLFFNHLDLPPAKVALMFFFQKLYRFIASKSWKKLQSFQFIFSKTRKNVKFFSINSIYRQQTSSFFGRGRGKITSIHDEQKSQKMQFRKVKLKTYHGIISMVLASSW